MEKEFYHCEYCFKEYTPKRRRVQKYCSDSCRSKAHHARKSSTNKLSIEKTKIDTPTIGKIDKMSLAGTGNAIAGVLIADGVKSVFTKEQNKPATKGDLASYTSKLKRFHKVANMYLNDKGATPYFDMESKEIIYSLIPLYR